MDLGLQFVTRKISNAVAQIHLGMSEEIELGNLDARRDWGHAQDYMRGVYDMMCRPSPTDYVLATGETRTVREFTEAAFLVIGISLR